MAPDLASPAREDAHSGHHAPTLKGVWKVRRVGGLLPPMPGMVKEVRDAEGETRVGPVRMPFDVVGMALHYRKPLNGLVDELTPADHGFRGRAVWKGRKVGEFELHRL